MKSLGIKLLSALFIMLFLFACTDLKKEVTIKTIGGEKKVLEIKAPKKYAKNKEIYFISYALFYMASWNEGVDESDNSKSEYRFNLDRYIMYSKANLQSDIYLFEEICEYLDEKKDISEKIKAEGRAFANKKKDKD